jgi:hypothetical protein
MNSLKRTERRNWRQRRGCFVEGKFIKLDHLGFANVLVLMHFTMN